MLHVNLERGAYVYCKKISTINDSNRKKHPLVKQSSHFTPKKMWNHWARFRVLIWAEFCMTAFRQHQKCCQFCLELQLKTFCRLRSWLQFQNQALSCLWCICNHKLKCMIKKNPCQINFNSRIRSLLTSTSSSAKLGTSILTPTPASKILYTATPTPLFWSQVLLS